MSRDQKLYCSSAKIMPYQPNLNSSHNLINHHTSVHANHSCPSTGSASILIGTVDGHAVGTGSGKLYSAVSENAVAGAKGTAPLSTQGDSKVNPSDPQVRKLVYNMYRGLLNTKHERANNIVESAPKQNISTDEGVADRVLSMMRQQSSLKEEKMNYGPPPPPPPPPFSTGTPPVKLPSEIAAETAASRAPPMMPFAPAPAIPAALAGAMMKDKKPFTYTPGGLNLAEINAQTQPQQNGGTSVPFQIKVISNDSPVQSKSFRVLQNAYDGIPESSMPTQQQQQQQQNQPNTMKYTGSNIPSRSFQILQAMTDVDDVQSDDAQAASSQHVKLRSDECTAQSDCYPKHTSPTFASSASSTRFSPTCSLNSSVINHGLNDSDEDTGSYVAPTYTSTRDSPVYRHVAPTIVKGDDKGERIVNSALCNRRENSPRPWHSRTSGSTSPVLVVRSSSAGSDQEIATPHVTNGSGKFMNISSLDDQNSNTFWQAKPAEAKLLYEGSKIPSKVFKQLQSDYSSTSNAPHTASSNHMNPSATARVTEVYIPRLIQQQLTLNRDQYSGTEDDSTSYTSSSNPECEDQYRSDLLETAVAKESVLKELTSHFDPQTTLKKPRAAPGRVFRYLQEQFDDPSDTGFGSMHSSSSVGNSTNVSPDGMHLSSSPTSMDSGHYEIEPKPYGGSRIPGRTFRMLQENYETHPSVLQARK